MKNKLSKRSKRSNRIRIGNTPEAMLGCLRLVKAIVLAQ